MFARVAFALFSLLILTTPVSQAQTVDLYNALVYYFDEDATERSWYGTGEVTVYLVAGPLMKFEDVWEPFGPLNTFTAEYFIWPPENYTNAVLTPRGVGNPSSVAITDQPLEQEIQFLEPLPMDGRTVVAELTLTVLSDDPVWLWAMGGPFVAGGFPAHFVILTSGPDGPMDMTGFTAAINAPAPVSTESASWSGVKALYR